MTSLNVAEAKKRFSDLLSRVAYKGESVLITRRGKPMAKLVPADAPDETKFLDNVEGWLEEDDPFFAAVDEVVAGRSRHVPRVLRTAASDEDLDP